MVNPIKNGGTFHGYVSHNQIGDPGGVEPPRPQILSVFYDVEVLPRLENSLVMTK